MGFRISDVFSAKKFCCRSVSLANAEAPVNAEAPLNVKNLTMEDSFYAGDFFVCSNICGKRQLCAFFCLFLGLSYSFPSLRLL